MLEVLPDAPGSGMVRLNLHGTLSNQFYHIQSATGLSGPVQWREESSLLGLDGATPVNPIAKLNRAALFLRARTADWGIISQPLSQDLSAGDTVTLSVGASGVGPFGYQWSLNGVAIPGATNSTYTITNLQSTTAGAYAATVTRGSEFLQSGPAQLTVEPWSWSVAQADSVSANDDFLVHAWNGSGYTTKQVTFSNLVAAVNSRNGWVTPYDLGAAGDGITDDTVALQRWLNVAEASNYVAYLAPARGNYYMISDTLWATNSQGLRLIGAGGQDHISSPRTTKAHIHQMTAGKSGIVIGNSDIPSAADGIYIDGIVVTAETFSSTSHGIAFDANSPDSDCCVIQACGIRGFGVGLFIASAADTIVRDCSFGGNGDGAALAHATLSSDIPVINQIRFEGCQLSYNRTNQLHISRGYHVAVLDCDVAPTANWPTARGILLDGPASIYLERCNLERYTDAPGIVVANTNLNYRLAYLKIKDSGITPGNLTANTYSLIVTNSTVEIENSGLAAASTADGFAVLDVNTLDGNPCVSSDTPLLEKFISWAGTVRTNWLTQKVFSQLYGDNVPARAGQFKVLKRGATFNTVAGRADCCFDDMTEFKLGAQFAPITGSSAVQEIDLLDYAKEKLTIAPFNFVKAVHYTGSLSQPPAITAGMAAGTGADVSLDGAASDSAMTVTVTAGASPASGSAICTVHFGTAFTSPPHVMVCPANGSAAGIPVYIASPGQTQFSLNIASTQTLAPAGTYQWNIIVIQ